MIMARSLARSDFCVCVRQTRMVFVDVYMCTSRMTGI